MSYWKNNDVTKKAREK
ncbi:SPP1 phage holin family protein [Cytobacillus kochii]|nr:SPP1 phage holin family protein [Cytobacillus kochii]MCM3321978.1 SPP1 phage holin family protein [Cytobacillus kochii]MCM3343190.1 SPP1 phage holin family protein [Cytobacillus kochii]